MLSRIDFGISLTAPTPALDQVAEYPKYYRVARAINTIGTDNLTGEEPMEKPALSDYSLEQAAEFLSENSSSIHSVDWIESLIQNAFLTPGIFCQEDGEMRYMTPDTYEEIKLGNGDARHLYNTEEEARLGRLEDFKLYWIVSDKKDVRISIGELTRYLSGTSKNTQAARLKAHLKSIGTKNVEDTRSCLDAIIDNLEALAPGFDRFIMPGRAKDFQEFCGRFSPKFTGLASSSFKEYYTGKNTKKDGEQSKKLCRFKQGSSPSPEYWKAIYNDWDNSI